MNNIASTISGSSSDEGGENWEFADRRSRHMQAPLSSSTRRVIRRPRKFCDSFGEDDGVSTVTAALSRKRRLSMENEPGDDDNSLLRKRRSLVSPSQRIAPQQHQQHHHNVHVSTSSTCSDSVAGGGGVGGGASGVNVTVIVESSPPQVRTLPLASSLEGSSARQSRQRVPPRRFRFEEDDEDYICSGTGSSTMGAMEDEDNLECDHKTVEQKLGKNVRNRAWTIVRQDLAMNENAEQLVGCSMKQYRQHIERQWLPGMSWQNYGSWHIDHIRSLSNYRLVDPLERVRAFHFSNTRPLWAHTNLSKGTSPAKDTPVTAAGLVPTTATTNRAGTPPKSNSYSATTAPVTTMLPCLTPIQDSGSMPSMVTLPLTLSHDLQLLMERCLRKGIAALAQEI